MNTPSNETLLRAAPGASFLVLVSGVLASCGGGDPAALSASVDAAPRSICISAIEGCGCTIEGQTQECFPDPLVENGASVCLVGERTCAGGTWGACEDVRRLVGEDGRDVVIEAASDDLFACSPCEPLCFQARDFIEGDQDILERGDNGLVFNPALVGGENTSRFVPCADLSCGTRSTIGVGSTTPWNPTPGNSDGVVVDPADGALVIGVAGDPPPGIWVSNMSDGTISRLDPRSGLEIGRYFTARPSGANGARPAGEYCNWADTGNCPSRTAIDQNFDCYVANRAFGNQGTVTKIAADFRRCVDRNANGRIDTSADTNGDGRIDQSDPAEFPGVNDECLLWTVPVGGNNGVPRALAIGVAAPGAVVGDVWVGNFNEARTYRLRPEDGATLGSISLGAGGYAMQPYGAAADTRGRIFFYSIAYNGGYQLGYVTPASGSFDWAANQPTPSSGYGIAYYISPDGSQEYFFTALLDPVYRVARYNVLANNWISADSPARPRGMAADTFGNVYAALDIVGPPASYTPAHDLVRWDTNLANRQQWTAPSASQFMGVGVTFDNAVWLIGSGGARAARLSADRTSWLESPSVFSGPYTYSDFVGYGLNVFANPRGHYSFVTDAGDGCEQRWQTAEWAATVPAGTAVEIWVRSADTQAGLDSVSWIGPFASSPANLTLAPGPVPNARFLEMDIRMSTTDRRLTPRVRSASAAGFCDRTFYETGATYTRLYDSTQTEDEAMPRPICDPRTDLPIWGDFTWNAVIPERTSIRFEFRAGRDASTASAATPVVLTATSTTVPLANLSNLFVMAGRPGSEIQAPYMQVRAVLNSSSDMVRSPTLRSFQLEFNCMPGS
jgi:hypothetical protein